MNKTLIIILISFLSRADISEIKYKEKEVDVVGLFVGDHASLKTKMYYIVDKTNRLCFARFINKKISSGGMILVPCGNLVQTPSFKKHITWIED